MSHKNKKTSPHSVRDRKQLLAEYHQAVKGMADAGVSYPLTFELSPDGKSIKCKRCKRVSYNQGDIEHHYCAHCKMFHDDIWPPAREWWITSYSE